MKDSFYCDGKYLVDEMHRRTMSFAFSFQILCFTIGGALVFARDSGITTVSMGKFVYWVEISSIDKTGMVLIVTKWIIQDFTGI